jgi:hypothetical protein
MVPVERSFAGANERHVIVVSASRNAGSRKMNIRSEELKYRVLTTSEMPPRFDAINDHAALRRFPSSHLMARAGRSPVEAVLSECGSGEDQHRTHRLVPTQ